MVEGNDNCRRCSRGQPSTFSHSKTRGIPHSDELPWKRRALDGRNRSSIVTGSHLRWKHSCAHTQWKGCRTRHPWSLASVLHTLLLCNLFETKSSLSSDKVPVELEAIADLYDDLDSCKTTMQDVESSVELQTLQMKLDMFTEALESKYLTAKLWLEYMEMVNIMRAFVRSERTGDWSLHL